MKYIFLSIFLYIFTCNLDAQISGKLSVSISTSETGGKYAPKNVIAIWIENETGDFIKTLLVYGNKRLTHLNTWQESTNNAGTEYNKVDAVTGATRLKHGELTCSWDGTDYNKALVPDGKYYLCMELTDKNETGNYSSFEFTKNDKPVDKTPSSEESFSDITIQWVPEMKVDIERVKPLANNIKYKVYPNPSSNMFTISGNEFETLELRKVSGELLFKTEKNRIDFTPFKDGIYLLYIYNKNDLVITKIVKRK